MKKFVMGKLISGRPWGRGTLHTHTARCTERRDSLRFIELLVGYQSDNAVPASGYVRTAHQPEEDKAPHLVLILFNAGWSSGPVIESFSRSLFNWKKEVHKYLF